VWQNLREEYKDQNFELVTVGLDTLGAEGCRAFIEAANPQHPSLIDQHHVMADLFGVVNIPSSVWIDENFNIVRPAEAAPAPPKPDTEGVGGTHMEVPAEIPQRMMEMMTEAAKIPNSQAEYHAALKDWVEKGASSEFVMSSDKVVERSRPRNENTALGHAHFELASELVIRGDQQQAIEHFRKAHELVPDSWTFRRQAWSLQPVGEGPLARFWQGPNPENPEDWPYEGGWLEDIKREGAENYNEGFVP
jgi:tetratricopeptide (TPR) repeat protein